jgi:hypothetical protein
MRPENFKDSNEYFSVSAENSFMEAGLTIITTA